MAQLWKEPYSLERALELGIRDFENSVYVGVPNSLRMDPDFRGWPQWIYYVEVYDFRFAFFSIEMIREYIEYYSLKDLPSSRFKSAFSKGPAASIGEGQTRFERLPLRLRKENKRVRIVRALNRAIELFSSQQ
jgi:hypothetical protein